MTPSQLVKHLWKNFLLAPGCLLFFIHCNAMKQTSVEATSLGTVTVNPVTLSTEQNTATTVSLSGVATSGLPLSFTVASPLHGVLANTNTAGSYLYTPATNYVGPDQFTYTASDGTGSSQSAVISIFVTAPPLAAPFAPTYTSSEMPMAVLESVQSLSNGQLQVTGWAFQQASASTCPQPSNTVAIYLDGMPYPYRNAPVGASAPGFGFLISVVTPSLPRPDVQTSFNSPTANVGFSVNVTLPTHFATTGYHTVHVLALHQCNDNFNVAAFGSPQIYGVNMPMDFAGMKAAETSFDPGMDKKLAAQLYPPNSIYSPYAPPGYEQNQRYIESCPDSATGCWDNGNQITGGFYTITNDPTECRITTDPTIPYWLRESYLNAGTPEFCPYEFSWSSDSTGKTVGTVITDTSFFTTGLTKNNYLGLQVNGQDGMIYSGLDNYNRHLTPDMSKVVAATVTIQDDVCTPYAAEASYGRFLYDFTWVHWSDDATPVPMSQEISVDLKEWNNATAFPSSMDTPFWTDAAIDPAFHLTAYKRYLAHPNFNGVNRTTDCTQTPGSFRTYIVPIRDLIAQLQQEGLVPADSLLPNASGQVAFYATGILGGIEHWGRALSKLQVKNHALFVNP